MKTKLLDNYGWIPVLMIIIGVALLYQGEMLSSVLGWSVLVMAVYPAILTFMPNEV